MSDGSGLVPSDVIAAAIIGNAIAGPAALQAGSFGCSLTQVTLAQQWRLTPSTEIAAEFLASDVKVTFGSANPPVFPIVTGTQVVVTREPATNSILISAVRIDTGALASVADPTVVVVVRRPFAVGAGV